MQNVLDKIAPSLICRMHLIVDCCLIPLALWGAGIGHISEILMLWSAAVACWLIGTAALRLYAPTAPRRIIDTMALQIIAVLGVSAAVVVLHALLPTLSDLIPVNFALLLFGGVVATSNVAAPLRAREPASEDVLIIGVGPLARATADRLKELRSQGRRVRGFIGFPGQRSVVKANHGPVLGTTDELLKILSEYPVCEIYIAGRVLEHGACMQEIVEELEEVGMPFAVPLHSFRLDRAQLLSSSAASDGYLHYLTTPTRPLQYALKRLFDISASLTALLLLSPLLLTVAAAIKLTSRGPVIFRQQRVGLHGTTFNLLKFRSMVVNAEELKGKLAGTNEQSGPVFKMKNDPRVTAIGRFIRKYSIDELPQLINILRGEMTIVGPRPAVPKEVVQYKAWQRRRLSVRPGLTCYWQVSGRNSIGFEEWMRLDLRYVDNWSFGLDMHLIARTVPVVITGRGAS